MNKTFNDSHLDTLVKLKALAEKHGMKIRFGTTNSVSSDNGTSALEHYGINERFIELLDEYSDELIDGTIDSSEESIWFELYEPRPAERSGYYSVMSYWHYEVHFRLQKDWDDFIDRTIEEINEEYADEDSNDCDSRISEMEKFREWLQDNSTDYGDFVSFNSSPTKIRGFGKEQEQSGLCYRDGMALHYFTELVCEYLKEPMIHNTY
jgi:hypothetical protein